MDQFSHQPPGLVAEAYWRIVSGVQCITLEPHTDRVRVLTCDDRVHVHCARWSEGLVRRFVEFPEDVRYAPLLGRQCECPAA